MKVNISFVALCLLILLGPLRVMADDDFKGTILNISTNEMEEIENDLLIASMRFENEGKDAREVQNLVNTKMQQALEMAKKYPDIKIKTENYSIYKYYPDPAQQIGNKFIWRASQGLSIKGKDSDSLLKLVGEYQDIGLLMNGLDYVVSPEKQEQIQDSLMERALAKLNEKAKRAAKTIGKTKLQFINININSNNYFPMPMFRNYAVGADIASKAAMVAPVASPGQSQVSLMVNAQVRLED